MSITQKKCTKKYSQFLICIYLYLLFIFIFIYPYLYLFIFILHFCKNLTSFL